jgi:hypothetical protein
MDLKRLISTFAYRIEPKPDGGFIAHATDPAVPPLEAATRLELQQKIQQTILTSLSTQFPGLKLPPEGKHIEMAFHIEHKPEGGFAIHSSDPNTPIIEAGSQQETESRFLEKFLGFAGKHLMPELAQALAAQGNTGDIKVVINRTAGFTVNSHTLNLGSLKSSQLPTSNQAGTTTLNGAPETQTADLGTIGGTLENAPITPEPSNFGKVFRLVIALLIVGALLYFFLRYR